MTSRLRMPRSSRALGTATVVLALIGAACGGGSDAAPGNTDSLADSSAPLTDPAPDAQPGDDPDATTATSPATTTTIPLRGASPDDPAPVGDPEFDLIGYDDGTDVVDAAMIGLVALPLDPEESGVGSCVAVLTMMTVQETEALVTSLSAFPRIELLDGDEPIQTDFRECDDSAADAAGYATDSFAKATPGTQVAVATAFHLADGVEPTALLLGRAGDELSRFYELTMLDAIPPLDVLEVGPVPADLQATSPDASETVRFDDAVLDSTSVFDVSVIGLTPVERSSFADVPGRCLTVVTTLIGVESPGAIINAFAVPNVFLLASGQAVEREIGECEDDTLEELGYFSDLRAGVAPGNTFAVQTSFVLPEGVEPDAIIVGEPSILDQHFVFQPTVLAEVPAAPVSEKLNPVVDLVAVGATSAFDLEGLSDTFWSGTIDGLVLLTNDAVSAVCYAVIGEIARDADGAYPPNIGIIADGGIWGDGGFTFAECDTAALEAAGYINLNDIDTVASAEPTKFFRTIFLPGDVGPLGNIAIGNAASGDDVVFVEPTILDAIPQP